MSFGPTNTYPISIIGAVDGKHILIKKPHNSGSEFYNYEGTCSIVLMAIVNSNYEFTFVDVGAQGSCADGGIWQQCAFKIAMDDGYIHLPPPEPIAGIPDMEIPFFVVGDDAFPLGPSLQKPYAKRDLTHNQRIYNYRLSRARRLSENGFGILSNRFRVFLTRIDRPPHIVQSMVLASCALHNALRRRCPRLYTPPGALDQEDNNFQVEEGTWRSGQELQQLGATLYRNPTRYAKGVQEALADYFVGEGSVPWQDAAIFASPNGKE